MKYIRVEAFGRSFITIMNNIGNKFDPCGTPKSMALIIEKASLHSTT